MSDSEQIKPIRKTWIMLKKAIPAIIPSPHDSGSGAEWGTIWDAQWNTGTGYNKNATQWGYMTGTRSTNRTPFNVINGVWVDNNYLSLDGTGYLQPVVQKETKRNSCNEVFVVEGIGQIYSKYCEGYPLALEIMETGVKCRYKAYTELVLNVPGVDVRMIAAMGSQLVVYDKYGKRYVKDFSGSTGIGNRVYVDSATYFKNFKGKIYCIKDYGAYMGWDGIIKSSHNRSYECADKEWEYAKNRFRL